MEVMPAGARLSSPSGVSSHGTAALLDLCSSDPRPAKLHASNSRSSPSPNAPAASPSNNTMQLNGAAIRHFLLDCRQHSSATPAANESQHAVGRARVDSRAECVVAKSDATLADAAPPGTSPAHDGAAKESNGGRSHGSQHEGSELTNAGACASEAVSEEKQDLEEADAAEVLLSFHTHRYEADDLDDTMSGDVYKESASASDAEAEPGVRTSKRKRKANTWLTADFEPSIEEESWDKVRERRAKQGSNTRTGKWKEERDERADVLTHTSPAFQQLSAPASGMAGGYVTLQSLRLLRDSGRPLEGLEVLVHMGGDIRSPQAWQLARVAKCDVDFKRVVVRFAISGDAEAIDFHAADRVVLFPAQPEPLQLGCHLRAGDASFATAYVQQLEYLRQLQMLQLSQRLAMGGWGAQQDLAAQLAAYGSWAGQCADAWPQQGAAPAEPRVPRAPRSKKPAAARPSKKRGGKAARSSGAARTTKVPSATAAIARALGLGADAILPERNPQVKLRATMFDALCASLQQGRDKIMCKVTAERGMRTAVLTGATLDGSGILVKYLDVSQPAVGVITQSDLAEERIVLEVTQVIPISE